MKIILAGDGKRVTITMPVERTMRALTGGGLGRLPGDAVTADLAENEAKRIEVSQSMPHERAIENMIRDGLDAGFADYWCSALVSGGETDATALEMIRIKDVRGFAEGDCSAVEHGSLPTNRFFRNAWRKKGDGIVVDLPAARMILAERLISAKAIAAKKLEVAITAGNPSDQFEAAYAALVAMDLRKLGQSIAGAKSTDELMALWPKELPRGTV